MCSRGLPGDIHWIAFRGMDSHILPQICAERRPSFPAEERRLGKLLYCPDLINVFTLLPVRIDFPSLEAHGHESWCLASVEN